MERDLLHYAFLLKRERIRQRRLEEDNEGLLHALQEARLLLKAESDKVLMALATQREPRPPLPTTSEGPTRSLKPAQSSEEKEQEELADLQEKLEQALGRLSSEASRRRKAEALLRKTRQELEEQKRTKSTKVEEAPGGLLESFSTFLLLVDEGNSTQSAVSPRSSPAASSSPSPQHFHCASAGVSPAHVAGDSPFTLRLYEAPASPVLEERADASHKSSEEANRDTKVEKGAADVEVDEEGEADKEGDTEEEEGDGVEEEDHARKESEDKSEKDQESRFSPKCALIICGRPGCRAASGEVAARRESVISIGAQSDKRNAREMWKERSFYEQHAFSSQSAPSNTHPGPPASCAQMRAERQPAVHHHAEGEKEERKMKEKAGDLQGSHASVPPRFMGLRNSSARFDSSPPKSSSAAPHSFASLSSCASSSLPGSLPPSPSSSPRSTSSSSVSGSPSRLHTRSSLASSVSSSRRASSRTLSTSSVSSWECRSRLAVHERVRHSSRETELPSLPRGLRESAEESEKQSHRESARDFSELRHFRTAPSRRRGREQNVEQPREEEEERHAQISGKTRAETGEIEKPLQRRGAGESPHAARKERRERGRRKLELYGENRSEEANKTQEAREVQGVADGKEVDAAEALWREMRGTHAGDIFAGTKSNEEEGRHRALSGEQEHHEVGVEDKGREEDAKEKEEKRKERETGGDSEREREQVAQEGEEEKGEESGCTTPRASGEERENNGTKEQTRRRRETEVEAREGRSEQGTVRAAPRRVTWWERKAIVAAREFFLSPFRGNVSDPPTGDRRVDLQREEAAHRSSRRGDEAAGAPSAGGEDTEQQGDSQVEARKRGDSQRGRRKHLSRTVRSGSGSRMRSETRKVERQTNEGGYSVSEKRACNTSQVTTCEQEREQVKKDLREPPHNHDRCVLRHANPRDFTDSPHAVPTVVVVGALEESAASPRDTISWRGETLHCSSGGVGGMRGAQPITSSRSPPSSLLQTPRSPPSSSSARSQPPFSSRSARAPLREAPSLGCRSGPSSRQPGWSFSSWRDSGSDGDLREAVCFRIQDTKETETDEEREEAVGERETGRRRETEAEREEGESKGETDRRWPTGSEREVGTEKRETDRRYLGDTSLGRIGDSKEVRQSPRDEPASGIREKYGDFQLRREIRGEAFEGGVCSGDSKQGRTSRRQEDIERDSQPGRGGGEIPQRQNDCVNLETKSQGSGDRHMLEREEVRHRLASSVVLRESLEVNTQERASEERSNKEVSGLSNLSCTQNPDERGHRPASSLCSTTSRQSCRLQAKAASSLSTQLPSSLETSCAYGCGRWPSRPHARPLSSPPSRKQSPLSPSSPSAPLSPEHVSGKLKPFSKEVHPRIACSGLWTPTQSVGVHAFRDTFPDFSRGLKDTLALGRIPFLTGGPVAVAANGFRAETNEFEVI
ncbi:UNVERIFIED_CONTAM: hypothetical protein HHA_295740 [Hammondia hammondi]|eukprot:XP_008888163.1 hypothetical protein HHA_295740 [Hammondia hammondi]